MTAAPDWEIRRYREGDEAGINELFHQVFGKERSPEEWRWKFRDGPLGNLPFIHLAQHEERIVGQMAGVAVRFHCQGREVRAVQPVDNMIDPAYRGRLGRSRMQSAMFQDGERAAREAGIALGYGFPNPEAYRVGTRLLGYRDLGRIEVRSRSLTWARHARRLVGEGRIAQGIGRLQARSRSRSLRVAAALPAGATVRQVQDFDARFDSLWTRASDSFGMLAVRDRQCLHWRYREKPQARYTLLVLERGAELLGYTVLAVREDKVRTGLVADVLCLPIPGAPEALLEFALKRFLDEGLDLAECWSPTGGLYEKSIHGYFPRTLAEPVRAVYKLYDETVDPRAAGDIGRWHLMMGDSDGV